MLGVSEKVGCRCLDKVGSRCRDKGRISVCVGVERATHCALRSAVVRPREFCGGAEFCDGAECAVEPDPSDREREEKTGRELAV